MVRIALYIAQTRTSQTVFGKEFDDLSIKEREELRDIKIDWRKVNDLDCIWLDGDPNADTIFSLWTPLKMCLQCLASNRFKWVGNENIPIKSILTKLNLILMLFCLATMT